MSKFQIFIARHGQNEDNIDGVLNGHRDLPLTELGREQARQLGEGIKSSGLNFDAVYCSPLSRAHETAVISSKIAGLPTPQVMDILIERDFGIMTGRKNTDIVPMCAPDIIETDTITYFLSPEGAETFPELVERGREVLSRIRAYHQQGKILLVCHGDIGKMIYAAATGRDWRDILTDFHFGNGELIDISSDGDAHVLKLAQHNL